MSALDADDTTTPAALPLQYASPTRLRRLKPVTGRTVAALFAVAFVTGVLSMTAIRIIPGGPFISVHADVVPLAACLAVIAFAWPGLRSGRPPLRFCTAGLILGSALVVIFVVEDVLTFWLRPYARGALFGW